MVCVIYYVPCRTMNFHSGVLSYDTEADLKSAGSWSVYDAAGTEGLDTRGYYGPAFDGR